MWCLQENQRLHILAHWYAAPIANHHINVYFLEHGLCHWLSSITRLQCYFYVCGLFDKIHWIDSMLYRGGSLDSWASCIAVFLECGTIFWHPNICYSWQSPKIHQWLLAILVETTWITCYSNICSPSLSWWSNRTHELHDWSNYSCTFTE